MRMGGLSYNSGTENRYRYNGKEYHQELNLGLYDYGFRWYDPATARFVSVDPLAGEFPHNATYAYAENRPIDGIDLEGLEWSPPMKKDPESGKWVPDSEAALEMARSPFNLMLLEFAAGETPGIGEVKSLAEGDYLGAAIGLIPGGSFINKARKLKRIGKSSENLDILEGALQEIADFLKGSDKFKGRSGPEVGKEFEMDFDEIVKGLDIEDVHIKPRFKDGEKVTGRISGSSEPDIFVGDLDNPSDAVKVIDLKIGVGGMSSKQRDRLIENLKIDRDRIKVLKPTSDQGRY